MFLGKQNLLFFGKENQLTPENLWDNFSTFIPNFKFLIYTILQRFRLEVGYFYLSIHAKTIPTKLNPAVPMKQSKDSSRIFVEFKQVRSCPLLKKEVFYKGLLQ